MKRSTKILLGLLVVFVLIQFKRIDKTNPPVVLMNDLIEIEKPNEEVANLLRTACYDCHSNNSAYPWYTDIAPFSWWIQGHIDHGREHLNYSDWGKYNLKKKLHKLEEHEEFLSNGSMPLSSYKIMHPEARISKEERKLLIDYFKQLREAR